MHTIKSECPHGGFTVNAGFILQLVPLILLIGILFLPHWQGVLQVHLLLAFDFRNGRGNSYHQ